MRVQSTKDDRSAGDTSGQKQDPIERRRLQNRLSQRNHRRKIRDRIAKLQERVIASELRAAASLNGWDHPNPLVSSPVERIPTVYDPEGHSSPIQEASSALTSPYLSQSRVVCSSCNNALGPIPVFSPQSSLPSSLYEVTNEYDPTASSMRNGLYYPRQIPSSLSPEMVQNMSNLYPMDPNTQPLCEQWNAPGQYPGSSLYYIATENSLPQVMQALGSGPSRPKAIIVLPPNGHPSGLPVTMPTSQSSSPGGNGSDMPANSPLNIHEPPCQCQNQGLMTPNEWVNSGSSAPICPLHQVPAGENSMQLMML
ncbi:hypothetical protein BO70DRAFT_3822 [Aspergillus heteromorphus CBS 117.55]|uniref:BZIP domain-containing protein n=1 Tax=Aspergillus heteromorphus CBS 117.55 TaxID=1448321 RepID=A0A317X0Q7_9EURO|nr:uncharacterized protein BO70DRAFT_3822 [Aspergillus heteromorphus CBS 117.55]PWY92143.1 hypothetical protein BO70DRAFT_3822 [Aspergillus heteromorphus CBS 117.55]